MTKDEVQIGAVYAAKVTDKVVPVRIDKANTPSEGGGWDATNLKTNRSVHIKSAQRLRERIESGGDDVAAPATPTTSAKKKLTKKERDALIAAKNAKGGDDTKSDAKATTDTTNAKERDTSKPVAKPGKRARSGGGGKLSLLDAAVMVLAESKEPLNTKAMVAAVTERGLWSSSGKTPSATLYAAILRELKVKGNAARFEKVERGHFQLTAAGKASVRKEG